VGGGGNGWVWEAVGVGATNNYGVGHRGGAGPREPHLGLSIRGQALGRISKG
jgi:hypothetical protein